VELYLDTGDLAEVERAVAMGVLAGVTTNPTLLSARGPIAFRETIQAFCAAVPGPVSAEVVATEHEAMLEEAREISTWAPNVVVKLPMTENGLRTLAALRRDGWKAATNVTLIFSPNQALMAARAGATYVSPFVGRLDDVSHDGMQVVRDTVQIFRQYGISTRVIAASIRHPVHCVEAARAGADIGTMPFKVMMQMLKHPLTDIGLERFLADWRAAMGDRGATRPLASGALIS